MFADRIWRVSPVLLPWAPNEPELCLFLGNRSRVDLCGGLEAEGIAKPVLGITGEELGERLIASISVHVTGKVPTPGDSLFLDEVFELAFN